MDALTRTDDITAEGPLLFARVLDGKGGGRPISWNEVNVWKPAVPGEVLWAHLCRTEPGVLEFLENDLDVPEPTAELLTGDMTRPRAFRDGEVLVATLRGINFNPGALPEDMVSMQLWCDGVRLITLRRFKLQTPRDTLGEIDEGRGPTDAGALVTSLTEHMVHRMNAAIVDMNDELTKLEDLDFDEEDPDPLLRKIATIRRNCLALQRHMGPQHVALEAISRDAPEWFEGHDRREIGETIALLRRFLDDIDVSKESAVVLLDELRGRSLAASERTNYLLTIVAAIFLPLSFLTGLLGINVDGMPGAGEGLHPYAFWTVVGVCAALIVLMLWLFRRWKWL
ncbi:zinc transporter ZntB [Altererythrobacter salegens]|uniref:Zinc transporter ZntB n=1 Tax=Croceibacterium salegens TaxID=1737568 RepID=A0A6I4SVP2_9SPHN|nr:CorA family divalent cation transporter [Croceibacterium salegens]MXO60031.1 zinc transporter ZntB [Croceibacterium salegens]